MVRTHLFASTYGLICRRCGGSLADQTDHCPHCGTADPAASRDAADVLVSADAAPRQNYSGQVGGTLGTSFDSKPKGAVARVLSRRVRGDIAYPSLSESQAMRQPGIGVVRPLAIALAVAGVAALALVGMMALQVPRAPARTATPESDVKSAAGSIAAAPLVGASVAPPAVLAMPTGPMLQIPSIAPIPPMTPIAPPIESLAAPALAQAPIAASVPLAADEASAVRAALARRDLAAARDQITALPPGSDIDAELQRARLDLVRQERKRDIALQRAESCERTRSWGCMRRHANAAQAIDVSSSEAGTLLQRANSHRRSTRTLEAAQTPRTRHAAHTTKTANHAAPASPDVERTAGVSAWTPASSSAPGTLTIFGFGVPTVAKGRGGEAH